MMEELAELTAALSRAPLWLGLAFLIPAALGLIAMAITEVSFMKARNHERHEQRQARNAELCGLPLTEYLALSRRERRRRLQAAHQAQQPPMTGADLEEIEARVRRGGW